MCPRKFFKRAEEWPETLAWAIKVGDHQGAQAAAKQLDWPQVHAVWASVEHLGSGDRASRP
jgi:hypothetical protein